MPEVTVSLSDEVMRRLEELSQRAGLSVPELVRLGVGDLVVQRDEALSAAVRRVLDENAELYRRVA